MKIDLNELSYKDKIDLTGKYIVPEEFLENSKILGLDEVEVTGFLKQNEVDEICLYLEVKGKMDLEDSVTLDKIPYEFSFTIDEILEEDEKNNQNTLDIIELLWENIVLEVPIRYTLSDARDLKGDNWKVINEEDEDKEIDPRMQKLYEYNEGGE